MGADSWLAAMLTASCNGGLIGLSRVETTAVTLTRGSGDGWRRGGRGVDTDRWSAVKEADRQAG